MSEIQYGHRIASNLADINGQRLKQGKLTWKNGPRSRACNEMAGYPISFSLTAPRSKSAVLARAKRFKGLDLIVVDYLQIMVRPKTSLSRSGSHRAEPSPLTCGSCDRHGPGRQTQRKGRCRGSSWESGNIGRTVTLWCFSTTRRKRRHQYPQADIYGGKALSLCRGISTSWSTSPASGVVRKFILTRPT